jgi:hypothetical protein
MAATSVEGSSSVRNTSQTVSLPCLGRFGKSWLLLPLLWLSSSCTLITVGNTVKKDFAPALSRGDVPKLMRHSTPGLGHLFAHFTEGEIRQLMRWGSTPPPSKSKKTGKTAPSTPPATTPKISGSLDDFSSNGDRARLRVKSGSVKYTFVMQRIHKRWLVDDIVIHRPGGPWSFQAILGMFVTAKNILEDARQGLVSDQRMSPELVTALSPMVERLPAWGLLNKPGKDEPEEAADREPLLAFVDLSFSGDDAVAVFRVAGVPVDLKVRRLGKGWALQDVVFRVPGRPVLPLLWLARAIGPALVTLGDMRYVHGNAPYAFARVRDLLDDDLSIQLAPVLAPVWGSLSPLLASRIRPAEAKNGVPVSADTSASAADRVKRVLDLLTWKQEGNSLALDLQAGTWGVLTRWSSDGRLSHLVVTTGKRQIQTRHLSGFAPFSRWWESVLTGQVGNLAGWLHEGLRLLDEPYASLEPLVPRALTLPPGLDALLHSVRAGRNGRPAGPATGPGPIPEVRLEHFSFTPERTEIEIATLGRRFLWSWHWRAEVWRLESLKLDRSTDLLPALWLLPPAWRALEGLTTRSADLFTSALAPDVQQKVGPGVKELFTTCGPWIDAFLREAIEVLLLTLFEPPQWRQAPGPTPPKEPPAAVSDAPVTRPALPVLDTQRRALSFAGRTLVFAPLPDGAWGLRLPEPPPVKARTAIADHALAIPELWPTLAGLYLGLATADTTALARFSSADFTRKVWRQVGGKRLNRLLDRLGVDVPLFTGRDLVGLLLPDRTPAVPIPATGTLGDMVGGLRSLSKVKPTSVLPALASKAASAGASNAPAVRILGTLVRADRRYPFAEIWLLVNGKRVDLNFTWDASRRLFVLHEIRVQLKVLGRDMTFGLKDHLKNFL